MLYHKQIIIKAFIKNPPKEEDKDLIRDWMRRLIENVNMNIVAGPFIEYVSAEGNEGLTGAVLIETSHASFHCWEKLDKPFIQFDLYSCADFNTEIVLNMFNEFDVVHYDWLVIDRNEDPKVVERGKRTIY